METFSMMMVIFIAITTACVIFCIISTLLCYLDFLKQKQEKEAEIRHMKMEIKACRELLRKKR